MSNAVNISRQKRIPLRKLQLWQISHALIQVSGQTVLVSLPHTSPCFHHHHQGTVENPENKLTHPENIREESISQILSVKIIQSVQVGHGVPQSLAGSSGCPRPRCRGNWTRGAPRFVQVLDVNREVVGPILVLMGKHQVSVDVASVTHRPWGLLGWRPHGPNSSSVAWTRHVRNDLEKNESVVLLTFKGPFLA